MSQELVVTPELPAPKRTKKQKKQKGKKARELAGVS
jgi:hypothetical protein